MTTQSEDISEAQDNYFRDQLKAVGPVVPNPPSLDTQIADLAVKVDSMQETLLGILAVVEMVKEEVTPFLETLAKHPMARMIGLGK